MNDQIILKGIISECIIGINDYERKNKQKVIVNITVFHEFLNLNDDIKKTINYSDIYKFTKKFISGTNYNLIETLGDNLAKKIRKNEKTQGFLGKNLAICNKNFLNFKKSI